MPIGYVTTDQIDFNEIYYGQVQPAVDMYRQVSLPMITALATPWPEQIMKYGLSEKNGYQVLSLGERPLRKTVQEATMYPRVTKYGYGIGSDLDTMRRSTSRQLQMAINRGFAEDSENVLLQFLKVLMTDPGTSNAGYGLYNGQFAAEEILTAPPRFQNNTFAAGHTHYYGTNNATLALAHITAAKQTIRHHGNMGSLAGFINSVQQQALEDLASFTQSSIIRSPISDSVAVSGFSEVFQLLGVTWHVTEMIPSGYMAIVETSGDETRRPMVMYEPANMRGLNLMPGPMNDYPLVESFFERWFGVKVANRGAGVAIQIVASTTYTNPTFNE